MLPVQCRMARVALDWGVRDLASKADKSPNTIARFERGKSMRPETVADIQRTLENGGVEFIAANGSGPGVRLTKRKGRR